MQSINRLISNRVIALGFFLFLAKINVAVRGDSPNYYFKCPNLQAPSDDYGFTKDKPNNVAVDTFRWLVGCNEEALKKVNQIPATYYQLFKYYEKHSTDKFKEWETSSTGVSSNDRPPRARKVPLCVTTNQASKDPRLSKFEPILQSIDKLDENSKSFFKGIPKVWITSHAEREFGLKNIEMTRIKPPSAEKDVPYMRQWIHLKFPFKETREGILVQAISGPLGLPFGEFRKDFDCEDLPGKTKISENSVVPCKYRAKSSLRHPHVFVSTKVTNEFHIHFNWIDAQCHEAPVMQFLIIAVKNFIKLDYDVFYSPVLSHFEFDSNDGLPYPYYPGWGDGMRCNGPTKKLYQISEPKKKGRSATEDDESEPERFFLPSQGNPWPTDNEPEISQVDNVEFKQDSSVNTPIPPSEIEDHLPVEEEAQESYNVEFKQDSSVNPPIPPSEIEDHLPVEEEAQESFDKEDMMIDTDIEDTIVPKDDIDSVNKVNMSLASHVNFDLRDKREEEENPKTDSTIQESTTPIKKSTTPIKKSTTLKEMNESTTPIKPQTTMKTMTTKKPIKKAAHWSMSNINSRAKRQAGNCEDRDECIMAQFNVLINDVSTIPYNKEYDDCIRDGKGLQGLECPPGPFLCKSSQAERSDASKWASYRKEVFNTILCDHCIFPNDDVLFRKTLPPNPPIMPPIRDPVTGRKLQPIGIYEPDDASKTNPYDVPPGKLIGFDRLIIYRSQENKRFHGFLLILGWLVLVPLSNFIARYMKESGGIKGNGLCGMPHWLFNHVAISFYGLTFMSLGLISGLSTIDLNCESLEESDKEECNESESVKNLHVLFGTLAFICHIPQFIFGWIRPVADNLRFIIAVIHSVGGYLGYCFAFMCAFIVHTCVEIYMTIILLGIVAVVMFIIGCCIQFAQDSQMGLVTRRKIFPTIEVQELRDNPPLSSVKLFLVFADILLLAILAITCIFSYNAMMKNDPQSNLDYPYESLLQRANNDSDNTLFDALVIKNSCKSINYVYILQKLACGDDIHASVSFWCNQQ